MANVKQLMLRDDIIAAVKAGEFHIYGVHTLSEALTLMTGLPIDTVNKKGRYRKETLFGKVLSRLMLWDENQDNNDDDIDEKKSKKKDKKQQKAKRQKKADKRKKQKRKNKKDNNEAVMDDDPSINQSIDQSVDTDDTKMSINAI